MRGPGRLFLPVLALAACTDVGIYGAGPGFPDGPRAAFAGRVCIPLATGDEFPVKVLFAVEGGANVSIDFKTAVVNGINNFINAQSAPNRSFALVAFHTVATGYTPGFVDPPTFTSAVTTFDQQYQEA